jgi:hypothetical protein
MTGKELGKERRGAQVSQIELAAYISQKSGRPVRAEHLRFLETGDVNPTPEFEKLYLDGIFERLRDGSGA